MSDGNGGLLRLALNEPADGKDYMFADDISFLVRLICMILSLYDYYFAFVTGEPARPTDVNDLDWIPTLNLPAPNGNTSDFFENGEGISTDAGVILSPSFEATLEPASNPSDISRALNEATLFSQDLTFSEEETEQLGEPSSNSPRIEPRTLDVTAQPTVDSGKISSFSGCLEQSIL